MSISTNRTAHEEHKTVVICNLKVDTYTLLTVNRADGNIRKTSIAAH